MHFESREAKKETKNKLYERKLEYKEKKKVISQQIKDEVDILNKRIDEMVDKLYARYVNTNCNPEIKSGDVVSKSVRGMNIQHQHYFKDCNRMITQERKEIQELQDNMTKERVQFYKKNEEDIKEIAWIRYCPASRNFSIDSFDGRKEKSPIVMRQINPKWVRSWLSVVSYRLTLHLPRFWIHVPIGDTSEDDDKADQHLLSNINV